MYHWEGFWKVIHWNAACWYKQQALAQIVLQATLNTICEICHPILLFGTILLLNLCDLPPYTLIWHYMFIRHTRVHQPKHIWFAQSAWPAKLRRLRHNVNYVKATTAYVTMTRTEMFAAPDFAHNVFLQRFFASLFSILISWTLHLDGYVSTCMT